MFDLLHHGSTLLVGEGNFSFTAALVDKYSLSRDGIVVATSYEKEDECFAKYGAIDCKKNTAFLTRNGAKVIHSVDATDISATVHRNFDAIIFQFPHTGRKSSIKQNRNLLQKFFSSAKHVLRRKKGFVIVTLCAGQGGTPVDSVKREKCNSWQIIEMAAASQFILTEVETFDAGKYPGYVSTGRRNWKNSFITSLAMSHKFMLGETLPCLREDWVICKSSMCQLPSALDMRITMLENSPEDVLLHSITSHIIKRLGCKDQYIADVIRRQCIDAAACGYMPESSSNEDVIKRVTETHYHGDTHSDHGCIGYHCASYFTAKEQTDGVLPNFHYNLVLVTRKGNSILTQFSNILRSHCNSNVGITQQRLPVGSNVSEHNSRKVTRICITSKHCEKTIGTAFKVNDVMFYHISLDDVLLSLRKDVGDKRVFWTLNSEAVAELKKAFLSNSDYMPRSLYPTVFDHDISFWINDLHDGNRQSLISRRLATLASLTADEAFQSIQHVEKYVDQEAKTSMLYRISYKSLHFALSRQQCAQLQLALRRYIEQFLGVQLR